jgi:hypothetical protein
MFRSTAQAAPARVRQRTVFQASPAACSPSSIKPASGVEYWRLISGSCGVVVRLPRDGTECSWTRGCWEQGVGAFQPRPSRFPQPRLTDLFLFVFSLQGIRYGTSQDWAGVVPRVCGGGGGSRMALQNSAQLEMASGPICRQSWQEE